MKLNVKFESPSSEILPRLVFNIYTFLIFPGNLGMYDSWLSEQVRHKNVDNIAKPVSDYGRSTSLLQVFEHFLAEKNSTDL
jgi:hypothetical protein